MEIQTAAIFSNTQQHFALTLESKRNHRKLQFLFRVEGGQQRHSRTYFEVDVILHTGSQSILKMAENGTHV